MWDPTNSEFAEKKSDTIKYIYEVINREATAMVIFL